MDGWRYWRIEDGHLVSPYGYTPLPSGGAIQFGCPKGHTQPPAGCKCGIHFFANSDDTLITSAIHCQHDALDLHQLAYTRGVAHGRIVADTNSALTARVPSWRCAAFQAQSIYTSADNITAIQRSYAIPVFDQRELVKNPGG